MRASGDLAGTPVREFREMDELAFNVIPQ